MMIQNKKETGDRRRITVTELETFLADPPVGFTVETLVSGYRVCSDPDQSLVLIDDLESCRGSVVFNTSLGRKVKMQNLWEYTSMRKSLVSKRIYLLVSLCKNNIKTTNNNNNKQAATKETVLQQFVVSIDGNDPLIKWQMEKGLDWTISSVAGESYRVDVDLTEALVKWASTNLHIKTNNRADVDLVWRDASFTLKYHSDALFDFPHWFGLSKRKFELRMT